MTRARTPCFSAIVSVLALATLAGCDVHELKAVRVAMPSSRFPISLSEYMVVNETVVSRRDLKVVGELNVSLQCARQGSTADVSSQINDQVSAAGGEGVIALGAEVSATEKCQDVTLTGEIVKRGGK